MSQEEQQQKIREQRAKLIKELEMVYANAFNRLTELGLKEGNVAKLTQVILNSKDGAITPLKKEIEIPLITKAANQS